MKEQEIKYEKANSERSNHITFTNKKGPKEGPRVYQRGDLDKYQSSSLWCQGCGFTKKGCRCPKEKK